MDVLDLHLNELPVRLRAYRDDLPPDLDRLVGRLLAKDPADRPGTAWSVRNTLATIDGRLTRPPDQPTAGRHRRVQPVIASTTAPAPSGTSSSMQNSASDRGTTWLRR